MEPKPRPVSLRRAFLYLVCQITLFGSQVLTPIKRPLTVSLLVDPSPGPLNDSVCLPMRAEDVASDPFTAGKESSRPQNMNGGSPQVGPVICTGDSTASYEGESPNPVPLLTCQILLLGGQITHSHQEISFHAIESSQAEWKSRALFRESLGDHITCAQQETSFSLTFNGPLTRVPDRL
jgi:hypothetical protein